MRDCRRKNDSLGQAKRLNDANWYERTDLLKKAAIGFITKGCAEEGCKALDSAREEAIAGTGSVGIIERPLELCRIAGLYSSLGKQDRCRETIQMALDILRAEEDGNPWKLTNNLCYVAYALAAMEGDTASAYEILRQARISLADIDGYYLHRREEILSYVKRFSDDEHLHAYLWSGRGDDAPADGQPHDLPGGYQLEKFLNGKNVRMLESAVARRLSDKYLSTALSGIHERWRRAVAWILIARMFLKTKNVRRAVRALGFAVKEADTIPCYWDRDLVFESVSAMFLEVSTLARSEKDFVDEAESITARMKDPWKKARALCRVAESQLRKKRFRDTAQVINHIRSHLLGEIDYRDRAAMSMLLMAEVFDALGTRRATGVKEKLFLLVPFLNQNRRQAEDLRRRAFSILDSLGQVKRRESLDEYEEFISLRSKMSPSL